MTQECLPQSALFRGVSKCSSQKFFSWGLLCLKAGNKNALLFSQVPCEKKTLSLRLQTVSSKLVFHHVLLLVYPPGGGFATERRILHRPFRGEKKLTKENPRPGRNGNTRQPAPPLRGPARGELMRYAKHPLVGRRRPNANERHPSPISPSGDIGDRG